MKAISLNISIICDKLMQRKEGADEEEIITQSKEKFNVCDKRSLKLQILTILPKSWNISKVQIEFETTNYMARQVKNL